MLLVVNLLYPLRYRREPCATMTQNFVTIAHHETRLDLLSLVLPFVSDALLKKKSQNDINNLR